MFSQKISILTCSRRFVGQHRIYIKDHKDQEKEATVFMFNDLMLLTKPFNSQRTSLQLLDKDSQLSLNRIFRTEVFPKQVMKNGFQVFSCRRSFLARTDTPQERDAFLKDCAKVKEIYKDKKVFVREDSFHKRASPIMASTRTTKNCYICDHTFGLFNAKKHCPFCGQVVCVKCLKYSLPSLSARGTSANGCRDCWEKESLNDKSLDAVMTQDIKTVSNVGLTLADFDSQSTE
eukprot:UN27875